MRKWARGELRGLRPALAAAATAVTLGCGISSGPDPVTNDPPDWDASHPASLRALRFESAGATLNGIVYRPPGAGPHPVVVLLHGFPGEERNLDLAQALRRAGWSVLFFHYRGAWGSGGAFSFGNAIDDVKAAVATLTSERIARDHGFDPSRVALVGHSMGGFAALSAGGDIDAVDCIVSIAGANFSLYAAAASSDPAIANQLAARLDALAYPLQGTSGRALVEEVVAAGSGFDTSRRAPQLAGKRVLLVTGTRDEVTPTAQHHAPLLAALREAGAAHASEAVLDSDHAFSSRRIALARRVTGWLDEACR